MKRRTKWVFFPSSVDTEAPSLHWTVDTTGIFRRCCGHSWSTVPWQGWPASKLLWPIRDPERILEMTTIVDWVLYFPQASFPFVFNYTYENRDRQPDRSHKSFPWRNWDLQATYWGPQFYWNWEEKNHGQSQVKSMC